MLYDHEIIELHKEYQELRKNVDASKITQFFEKNPEFDPSLINRIQTDETEALSKQLGKLIEKDNVEAVSKFFEERPTFNVNGFVRGGRSCLSHAISWDAKNVVSFLLSHHNININQQDDGINGRYPINYALDQCFYNNYTALDLLFKQKESLDVNNRAGDNYVPPAFYAFENNHMYALDLLLAHPDIDLYQVNSNSESLLHLALLNDKTQVIDMLLKHDKLPLDVQNKDKKTPVYIAIEQGKIDIAIKLIEKPDFNPNQQNTNNGESYLHLAIFKNQRQIVEALLKHWGKINVDMKCSDVYGNKYSNKVGTITRITPLGLALSMPEPNFDIIKMLIPYADCKATVYTKTSFNPKDNPKEEYTPLELLDKRTAEMQLSSTITGSIRQQIESKNSSTSSNTSSSMYQLPKPTPNIGLAPQNNNNNNNWNNNR